MREPTCPLCSGRLVRERKVKIGGEADGGPMYRLGWVCRECSAAWPIAIKTEGVFGTKESPLFHRGERSS